MPAGNCGATMKKEMKVSCLWRTVMSSRLSAPDHRQVLGMTGVSQVAGPTAVQAQVAGAALARHRFCGGPAVGLLPGLVVLPLTINVRDK